MDLQCGCTWSSKVWPEKTSRCPSRANGEDGVCESCRTGCGDPKIVKEQLEEHGRVRTVV